MSALQYVFGAVLIILAIFLIIVVLLQESRSAGLSGAISGRVRRFSSAVSEARVSRIIRTPPLLLCQIFPAVPTHFSARVRAELWNRSSLSLQEFPQSFSLFLHLALRFSSCSSID